MHLVSTGRKVPEDCNVIIEIPMNGATIKYEVDKTSGAISVDRFMATARTDDRERQPAACFSFADIGLLAR